jgi:UDP-glucose 4-epimerase
MKSILVTGVAGFLGRYVARYFAEQGYAVHGIDCVPPENAPLADLASYRALALPDKGIHRLLRHVAPEICIHCAGRASVPQSVVDPSADFYSSTVLTFEMLEAIRLAVPHCKFIFLSSAAVYGNPLSLPVVEDQAASPISPYGFHKLQCEQLCREYWIVHGVPTASMRIFSAYGPGLRRQVLWDMCRKVIAGDGLSLQGTGRESRDFIHAVDIAKAIGVIAARAPMEGEVYNLGSGREVTIADLAEIVVGTFGADCRPQFDGVMPPGTPANWQADIGKLRALGFSTDIPLEQGIKTFALWCRAEIAGI